MTELLLEEQQRLNAVKRYANLDTSPDDVFESILELARTLFGAPTVLISIIEEQKQSVKASYGLEVKELSQRVSFCAHTVLGSEVMVVADATRDPRFTNSPLVTGEPHIRFYAGAPLRTPDGYAIGTLCIINSQARHDFDEKQQQVLQSLADLIMNEFELRLTGKDLERSLAKQNHTETQLRKSKQELQTVLANTSDIIASFDPSLRYTYVNPPVDKYIGLPATFLKGKTNEQIGVPLHLTDLWNDKLRDVLQTRRYSEVEFNIMTDHGPIYFQSKIVPRLLPNGEVEQMITVTRDVTTMKQAQQELENFFELSQDLLLITTLDGEVKRLNAIWEKVFGYTLEELSQNMTSLLHPDDATASKTVFKRLRDGSLPKNYEHRLRCKDGSYRWLQWNGQVLLHQGIIFGIARDITEEKLGKLALQESETRFRTLFDTASLGICITDGTGTIQQTNAVFEKLFQFEYAEPTQQTITDLIPGLSLEARRSSSSSLEQSGPLSTLNPYLAGVRKNGSTFPLEVNLNHFGTNGQRMTVLFIADKTEQVKQQEQLELLTSAIVNTSEAILITEASPLQEPGPRIVYTNDAFTKTTGYSADEVLGRSPRFLQGERTQRESLDKIGKALKQQVPVRTELINYKKDGEEFYSEMNISPVRDTSGTVSHFVAVQSDITTRKRQELLDTYRAEVFELVAKRAPLKDSLHQLTNLLAENYPDLKAVIHYKRGQHLVVAHAPHLFARFVKSLNLLPIDTTGTTISLAAATKQLVVSEDILADESWANYHDLAKKHQLKSCWSKAITHEDGQVYGTFSLFSSTARQPNADELKLLTEVAQLAAIAMSQRKLLVQLEHQSFYDPLTGLGNRRFMLERLEQQLALCQQKEEKLAVIILDLDDFKIVNDGNGHTTGDALLKEVALRLKACLRTSDIVTRLGGDEFGLVLSLSNGEDSGVVIEKILETLRESFVIQEQTFDITVSLGVSSYPADARDTDTLLKHADSALHVAKAEGKKTYRNYHPSMQQRLSEQLELSRDLKLALSGTGLLLHYQPRVQADTGETLIAEVLLRWQHPTRGLLSPATFLGVAEKANLMAELDTWVLRESCRQLRGWQEQHLPHKLSCNLSAASFKDELFADKVIELLKSEGIDPYRLELEITENMLLQHPDRAATQLLKLKEALPGLSIAIDDFGTGHSSLAYLRYLPVDTLKIDRLFVRDLDHEDEHQRRTARAVISTIILLGHQLELNVIAEGVETESQVALLKTLGCTEIQGFVFSKPLSLETFLEVTSLTGKLPHSTGGEKKWLLED